MPYSSQPKNGHGAVPTLRGSTLLITNVTKLTGIAVVVNEALLRPTIRDSALAIAAAMIFGAQTAENVLLGLIDRMFPKDGR